MTDRVPAFIRARRSIRRFADAAVDPDLVDRCLEAACLAPAPHHSRPWRWVVVTDPDAKHRLTTAMGDRWRHDLGNDGVSEARIDALVAGSAARLHATPVLILGCLTDIGLDRYPDAARQAAERGMALLSLGAAVENLMLAATDLGLASCWVAAPIFCPDAARSALSLDAQWLPQALICVGHPHPEYSPSERPAVPLDELRVRR